ncbi:MAG: hypothetical protein WED59_00170 [Candidatus Woykebacteria bacterium]
MKFKFSNTIIFYLIFFPIIGYFTFSNLDFGAELIALPLISTALFYKIFKNSSLKLPNYLKIYILFLFAIVFSKYIVNSNDINFDHHMREVLLFMGVFIILLFIENTQLKKENIIKIVLLIKALIILAFVVAVIQYFEPSFFLNEKLLEINAYSDIDNPQRRIQSIFTWVHNMNIMVFSLPILLNVILGWEYTETGKIHSYWLILIIGIICLLSQSRNFLILYLVVVLYYFYKTMAIKSFVYLVIILTVGFSILIIINFNFTNYFIDRIGSDTYLTRIEAYYAFLYTFQLKLFWGTGGDVGKELLDFYGRRTRIHNGFFAVPYYYGVIGAVMYFSFIVSIYKYMSCKYKKSDINVAMVTFLCIGLGNFAVDYYVLFDIGLFMTLLFTLYIYKNRINQIYEDA